MPRVILVYAISSLVGLRGKLIIVPARSAVIVCFLCAVITPPEAFTSGEVYEEMVKIYLINI